MGIGHFCLSLKLGKLTRLYGSPWDPLLDRICWTTGHSHRFHSPPAIHRKALCPVAKRGKWELEKQQVPDHWICLVQSTKVHTKVISTVFSSPINFCCYTYWRVQAKQVQSFKIDYWSEVAVQWCFFSSPVLALLQRLVKDGLTRIEMAFSCNEVRDPRK